MSIVFLLSNQGVVVSIELCDQLGYEVCSAKLSNGSRCVLLMVMALRGRQRFISYTSSFL